MKNILAFMVIFLQTYGVSAAESFPVGFWEGYKRMGSSYQEFILEIDAAGNGYYGLSPNINKPTPICFKISKASLLNFVGYYKQENRLNGLGFSLILVPSIDNTVEAISVLNYPEQNSTLSESWSLVKIDQGNRNVRLMELCKAFIEKNT